MILKLFKNENDGPNAEVVLRLNNDMTQEGRNILNCWSLCALRLGLPKDIRIIISRIVWPQVCNDVENDFLVIFWGRIIWIEETRVKKNRVKIQGTVHFAHLCCTFFQNFANMTQMQLELISPIEIRFHTPLKLFLRYTASHYIKSFFNLIQFMQACGIEKDYWTPNPDDIFVTRSAPPNLHRNDDPLKKVIFFEVGFE